MHEGILLDYIKIFLYVCWDLGSFNVCEYVYREVKGVRFFQLYMEGNIYIDFYEQNSIPRGRLRNGSICRFYSGNAFNKSDSILFPHPFLEARGGCFIYLFTCGYLGDGEQRHNWIECAWLFLLLESRISYCSVF